MNGKPNPNQCYQPSSANSLNITRTHAVGAMITVNPSNLAFATGGIGMVTVHNSVASPEAASNVIANIAPGSNITIQNTTCGASLAIGANCVITFTSNVIEGPIIVPIAGDNTNTVNMTVTVANKPQISITGPIQQARVVRVSGSPLYLEVTNSAASEVNADMITITDKITCPNLSVNDAHCTSLAPGASCILELNSNTPYAPCTITISGSNTANSSTSLIAFFYLNGLVFEESGGSGKVVSDVEQEFFGRWTLTSNNISGAVSWDDGVANTDAIVIDSSCLNNPSNCAAKKCRDISASWYLPAINELRVVLGSLCSNETIPCDFGGFLFATYWSSTQFDNPPFTTRAEFLMFPSEGGGAGDKDNSYYARCIQAF